MNANEMLRAKRLYLSAARRARADRLVAAEGFRKQFPADLMVQPRGDSMDEVMAYMLELDRVEHRAAALEKYLLDQPLTAEDCALLGVDAAALAREDAAAWPLRQPIPDGLVLMTFDDATIDHYTEAAPILERYGGRGNFFVCEMERNLHGGPGFADKRLFMTWEQIAALSERGHEIVNHSLHHEFGYARGSAEHRREEITGLEARCAAYGIPKPRVFGYPGGGCDEALMADLQPLGYCFARGDNRAARDLRLGQCAYDPLLDDPLALPSFPGAPGFTPAQLDRCLGMARGGCVVLLAYHEIHRAGMGPMSFEEQVAYIYAHGGRCITFGQLLDYIDPDKARRFVKL